MKIPLSLIVEDMGNVRHGPAKPEADAALLASMKAIGLIQPITVRQDGAGGYVAITGNRRLCAAKALGWTEIDAIVRDDGAAACTMMQLHENEIRAGMSPVDVWLAVLRLGDEGYGADAIAATMNLSERKVQQLQLMGRLPTPLLNHIRETGDMPGATHLRVIANAPTVTVLAAWGKLAPKDNQPASWWNIASLCSIARIEVSKAIFEATPDMRRDLVHTVDLFDPPEHGGYYENVALFLTFQKQAAKQRIADAERLGYGGMLIEGMLNGSPTGCTWERKEWSQLGKLKKAERGEWMAVVVVKGDGSVDMQLWKKDPEKPKAPAKADAAAQGDAPAAEEKGAITKAGMEVVEIRKRKAVVELVDPALGPSASLLAIMTLVLRSKLPGLGVDVTGLLKGDALDLDNHGLIAKVAAAVLRAALEPSGRGERVALPIVERIGLGLGAEPRWEMTAEDLEMLKKDGLVALAGSYRMPPTGTQKGWRKALLQSYGKDGKVLATPDRLPALAWAPGPLPRDWQEPAHDEDGVVADCNMEEVGDDYEGRAAA